MDHLDVDQLFGLYERMFAEFFIVEGFVLPVRLIGVGINFDYPEMNDNAAQASMF